jgi:hypothetical protein
MSETQAPNPKPDQISCLYREGGKQAELYAVLDDKGRSTYLSIRLSSSYVAHEVVVSIIVEKLDAGYEITVEKSVKNKMEVSVRDILYGRFYTVDDTYVVVSMSDLENVKSLNDVLEIARQVYVEVQRITMSALSLI